MYRCTLRYNHGEHLCCNTKVMYEHILERYLLDNIRPMLEGVVLEAEIKTAPVKDNRDRIAALERKLDRLKELYVNDLITLDEYKTDRESIQSEIAATTALSAPNTPDLDGLKEILNQDWETLYSTFNAEEKRYFWRGLVREIRFDANRKIEVIFL